MGIVIGVIFIIVIIILINIKPRCPNCNEKMEEHFEDYGTIVYKCPCCNQYWI